MSETTYSQRYAAGDSNTAGTFAFDTVSAKDYAVSKLAFGAIGAVTYVSASDPLPVTISGGATSALQTTGNGYLATLAGAVSGTEVQVDVLTMPQVTVVGTGTFAVQAAQSGNWNIVNISGTVSLPTGASTLTEQQSQTTHLATLAGAVAGTEVQVDIVSGSVTIASGSITADTELPAAALLADNTANPTVPGVGAFGHVYDGSTWDRMPGTSADGVLVNLGGNNDVTVTGSVTANAGTNLNTSALALESGGNLAAAATSLAVIDDWDESDRAKVNLIVGQAGIAAGAGAVGATVPRVTLASDDPAVALLTTIDADTSALAAIDYVVGADVASLGVVGNGAAATAQRVTIANDSTGTITVTQGTATNLKTQSEAYQGGSAVGAANPLQVTLANGSVPSHAVTNAGTFAVQVDGTALTRLTDIETNTDSGAVIGNGAAATAQRVTIANDSTGILAGVTTVTTVTTCSTVTNLSQMGGQAIAMGTGTRSAGTQRVTIATDDVVPITDNSGSLTVDMPAVTTGGASIFRSIDLDESEEEVKGSAGTLYGGVVINLATGVRYLKVYNATAANVTVGTTTPVMTIPIPTQAGTANGAGFVLPLPACGVAFDTAITVAATTGVADADTGAPGANEVVVNLFYK